jgi:hypothetical protein
MKIALDVRTTATADMPPYLVYANVDFSHPDVAKNAGALLRWLKKYGPDGWNISRTMRFLKIYQWDFRNCLEWLSLNSPIGLKKQRAGKKYRRWQDQKQWSERTELQFFQDHTLRHGRIKFLPLIGQGHTVQGLLLSQEPKDPLDTICWDILSELSRNGTLDLRRCRYRKCEKFFRPPTARKFFCNDSCRARKRSDRMLMSERKLKEFRKAQREYMKGHRKRLEARRRREAKMRHVKAVVPAHA